MLVLYQSEFWQKRVRVSSVRSVESRFLCLDYRPQICWLSAFSVDWNHRPDTARSLRRWCNFLSRRSEVSHRAAASRDSSCRDDDLSILITRQSLKSSSCPLEAAVSVTATTYWSFSFSLVSYTWFFQKMQLNPWKVRSVNTPAMVENCSVLQVLHV